MFLLALPFLVLGIVLNNLGLISLFFALLVVVALVTYSVFCIAFLPRTAAKPYLKFLVMEVVLSYFLIALLWEKGLADDGYLYAGWRIPLQAYSLLLLLGVCVVRLLSNLKHFRGEGGVCSALGILVLLYVGVFLGSERQHPHVILAPFQELAVFPSPDSQYEVIRYGNGWVRGIFGFRERGKQRAIWLNGGCTDVKFTGWKSGRTLGFQIAGSPRESLVTVGNPRLQCGLEE